MFNFKKKIVYLKLFSQLDSKGVINFKIIPNENLVNANNMRINFEEFSVVLLL